MASGYEEGKWTIGDTSTWSKIPSIPQPQMLQTTPPLSLHIMNQTQIAGCQKNVVLNGRYPQSLSPHPDRISHTQPYRRHVTLKALVYSICFGQVLSQINHMLPSSHSSIHKTRVYISTLGNTILVPADRRFGYG